MGLIYMTRAGKHSGAVDRLGPGDLRKPDGAAYRRDHEGAGDAEARPAADGTAGRSGAAARLVLRHRGPAAGGQAADPRPVFDYVDGAADEEIAVAANVAAFRSWRFLPRVLAGVASADASGLVFSSTLPVPIVLGPTGYTRMMHPDGEIGGARSAARHGLPYTLSTMATTGVEELRGSVGPAAELWFQLYLTRSRGRSQYVVDGAG